MPVQITSILQKRLACGWHKPGWVEFYLVKGADWGGDLAPSGLHRDVVIRIKVDACGVLSKHAVDVLLAGFVLGERIDILAFTCKVEAGFKSLMQSLERDEVWKKSGQQTCEFCGKWPGSSTSPTTKMMCAKT